MADSNLTIDFLNLGRKIAVSGARAVSEAVKSKIAELTDSEEAFQKRVAAKIKAMTDSGFSEAEARKAVDDLMRSRLDKAFEKCAKPSGSSSADKKG